jgi:D-alanyl-D-alanine carboxypeptidase
MSTRGSRHQLLTKLVEAFAPSGTSSGITLSVYSSLDGFAWHGAKGNLSPDTQYFIASTTKLYVTCLCLILEAEGALSFNSRIGELLNAEDMKDLNPSISVKDLLSHRSGLPDYFQSSPKGMPSLLSRLMANQDTSWSYPEVIEMTLAQKNSLLLPGEKAVYSDTNYQILGRILETIESSPLESILEKRIFLPLNLKSTYLFTDPNDLKPISINFKHTALRIPRALASTRADGGIVSTSRESLIFVRAFFNGQLFPRDRLKSLYQWRDIFFPFEYGIGLMRFKLPWFFSPFRRFPELLGHSGLSGAFGFYCPEKGLCLAGTVNQLDSPSKSFRLMIRALDLFRALNSSSAMFG